MCEECVKKYQNFNKEIENIFDENAEMFINMVDKLKDHLPTDMFSLQPMEMNEEDGTMRKVHLDLSEYSQEEINLIESMKKTVSRSLIMLYIGGYYSVRYSDTIGEITPVTLCAETFITLGMNDGHMVNHVHSKRAKN